MGVFNRLMTGAAFACAVALGSAAMAADPPHGPGGPHGGGPPGGGPHGQVHMPSHTFHGAPPTFSGPMHSYRGGNPGGGPHWGQYQVGRPGHDLGQFNGRGFSRFTHDDRAQWEGGQWRHVEHNGHLGWWWIVGGSWFFYPQPIYPFPEYVGPDYYYNYDDYYPAPDHYWYYCEDPPGYYPDVQDCNVPWQQVPPED